MDNPGDSPDDGPPLAITTEDEFHEALQRLVTEAAANGVDVRGGWPVVDDGSDESWELEITKIARRTTAQVDDAEFPASSIIDAVAEREGINSTDLPPLYDSIGPDILENLHESDDPDQHIRFGYYGYTITVTSGGSITIDG
ncbi:HalOD1 output domain-containing protein [Halorarius halobius]|uniref:HalOD1 output domain-containing protein n=1 Tax=Halorarius halobius TaxID=2962671 RepID=UPI0020CF0154|nr:HalOD1 output domain-containing protein [Halorarius halobius]